ncbi:putative glutathione S-transferase [Camellia lanceoleosa]|uniref:Glutathione S-transferase n=1 Tax=Camellia lanceoleosa TaxID=1840588 RepID=A0ACC0HS26_9ERIC|nr:putative glutathione S-transferase [Camellia lanceoleosa]
MNKRRPSKKHVSSWKHQNPNSRVTNSSEETNIGIVDIIAKFITFWLGVLLETMGSEDLLTDEKLPILCKWKNAYVNFPVIKENPPPIENLTAYFRARQQPASGPKMCNLLM